MLLRWSRFTALIFGIGLAIGEAVINWGHWQYAPLWIVDYVCVAWLLAGFWSTRKGHSSPVLISAWAFTAGVFYMALFISLDPALAQFHQEGQQTLLYLIGLMLALTILGVLTSFLAYRQQHLAKVTEPA